MASPLKIKLSLIGELQDAAWVLGPLLFTHKHTSCYTNMFWDLNTYFLFVLVIHTERVRDWCTREVWEGGESEVKQ